MAQFSVKILKDTGSVLNENQQAMGFPRRHRTKLHSTNPIERLNKEVKRRADVVGIFPNEASIIRLIGAVLFEQNDESQTASRDMQVEAFAQIDQEESDPIPSIKAA